MGFEERSEKSRLFVQTLEEMLWPRPDIRAAVHVAQYGYETHIEGDDRAIISQSAGATARLIRFAPDFLLVNRGDPEKLHFLEYKVTQSPVKTGRLLSFLREESGTELASTDVGQMEAAAYDNYCALAQTGARVAVAVWSPFHPRPLLCEWIERIRAFCRGEVMSDAAKGSRTPYVNYDLRELRMLAEFLVDEHGVNAEAAEGTAAVAGIRLRELLPPL